MKDNQRSLLDSLPFASASPIFTDLLPISPTPSLVTIPTDKPKLDRAMLDTLNSIDMSHLIVKPNLSFAGVNQTNSSNNTSGLKEDDISFRNVKSVLIDWISDDKTNSTNKPHSKSDEMDSNQLNNSDTKYSPMQLSDQEKHTQLNLDSSLALGPATPMTKQKSREFVIQIPSITKKGKGIVRDILTKCTDLIVEIINESESNDPLNTINNKFFSPQSKILKLQVTSTLFGMLSKCLPARYYELIKRFDDRYGNETEEMTPELNAFLTLLTGNVDILSSLQLFSKNKTDRSNSQILIECPILNGVGLNDPKTPETVLNFIYNTQSGFMALQIKLLIIISDFSEGKSMLKYQLCKEEDVMQCVSIVKSQMHSMFFLLDEMFENESVSNYKQLLQIFHELNIQDTLSHSFKTLIDILGQFQQLLQTQKLNDDIVISLIFLCIELFCMKKSEETAFFRNCVNYQEEASKLLILIFSNYEHHRIFIIEEVILTIPKSKFKTADYRIANSKKMIHRHSSLLLQLVQSTNPILKEYEHLDKESVLYSEKLEKFMLKCKSDLQSANKCSQNILKFLVARITNTNKTDSKAKNGYDAEYKHILEALLKDVHILFLNLEWPIVNHFITQATLVLIQLLDDNNKNIDSSLRSIATEWLGDTSTIIRKQEKQDCEELKKLRNEGELLGPHTWINERYVDFLESLQDELLQTISDKSLDILFKQGLISFYVSTFVSEVSTEESFESIHPRTVQYIDSCISKLCSLKNDFKPNLKHQMVEYDSLTIFKYFQQSHNLSKLNDLILKSLIDRIHGDNIPARTKSLRSMFELLIDSSISSSIRHLILQEVTHSLSDNSPTVRDASMEVVCRYLLSQDESVLKTLISTASSRIMDLSVNVRKRAIKLFRDIYLKYDQLENMDILQDITIKLFSRLTDEETSVSDLAKKVIGDYFFSNATDSVGWEQLNEQSKSLMIQKMTILSNVFSSYSQSVPLFTIFMNSITTLGLEQYHQQVELMINALMQMILTANENDELDQMTRYSTTMNQLSIYFPKECSIHISSLYPFSKPSKKTTDKDSRIIQNVLNIITKSIVTVEYPDQQLIQLIETDLISMLSVQNQAVLKVAIPCLCAIVQHHSRNFGKIVNVIKLCVAKLTQFKIHIKELNKIPSKTISTIYRCFLLLSYIMASLNVEIVDSQDTPFQDLAALFPKRNIHDGAFDLISFYINELIHHSSGPVALEAYGKYLLSFPPCFVKESSMNVIKKSLSSSNLNLQLEMLSIIIEFLQAANSEIMNDERDADGALKLSILVGNATEFSEDGIPSALIQNYLDDILKMMLGKDDKLSRQSFQVIRLALELGIVHPLLCIPGICAMESCSNVAISQQAISVHQKLFAKHSSFIHTRPIESIQCIYQYQMGLVEKSISTDVFKCSFPHKSMIQNTYTLLRSKKSKRNEYIKMIINLFQFPKEKSFGYDKTFYQFLAINLAYLDMKTHDEVLHVIYHINLILSVSGEIVKSNLEKLEENAKPEFHLVIRSIALGLLITLRSFYQTRYGLSDIVCLEAKAASTLVSHAEKSIEPISEQQISLDLYTDDKQICNWYKRLSNQLIDLDDEVHDCKRSPIKRKSKSHRKDVKEYLEDTDSEEDVPSDNFSNSSPMKPKSSPLFKSKKRRTSSKLTSNDKRRKG